MKSHVYIDDVVHAFMVAGFREDVGGGVFNVATGKSVSVGEAFLKVVERVAIVTGTSVNIRHSPWPEGASEIEFRSYISDINCISATLGWRPTITLESGIDCMINKLMRGS